jgi:hypothetical protein
MIFPFAVIDDQFSSGFANESVFCLKAFPNGKAPAQTVMLTREEILFKAMKL